MLRGRRFSIGFDMRRGVRKLRDRDEDDHDHDTRGRVLALFNF